MTFRQTNSNLTVLIAETVSLGILSLPSSIAELGLIAGALIIAIFGLITLGTGFAFYHFRMRYPHVRGLGDAGDVLAGRVGAVLAEGMFQILLVFVMAAHVLTFGTMADAIAGPSMWKCSVLFKFIGAVVCFIATLPRSFRSNSYLSATCTSLSITTSSTQLTHPPPS
jgi:amino acid transporter